MSRVIQGLPLGSQAVIKQGGDRYRDMYGGAVTIEVTVDGVCVDLELDANDALVMAESLRLAARDSRAAYAAAHEAALARREQSSAANGRRASEGLTMKVSENAVNAALRVLTGKALFLQPEEMRAALEAAVPCLLADEADARRAQAQRRLDEPLVGERRNEAS